MIKSNHGFTLLEILVALLIFTILSMMLVSGLHSVMNAYTITTQRAERLHQLQLTLLMISRDVEQMINRPIMINSGREEQAFVGDDRSFTFTHLGLSNPTGTIARSGMQRTRYSFYDNAVWRVTWPVVDQAPQTRFNARHLLDVRQTYFQYLDKNGRFHKRWPVEGQSNESLPRAIRIFLALPQWGEMSELYVIPS